MKQKKRTFHVPTGLLIGVEDGGTLCGVTGAHINGVLSRLPVLPSGLLFGINVFVSGGKCTGPSLGCTPF